MAASETVYCLEKVTDYLEFERLCNDLMTRLGYSDIEPLGGYHDKGRDALHVSLQESITIFAYSVRKDWRVKLSEDAAEIQRHGHQCHRLVFVSTSVISAGHRDEIVATIRNEYGWEVEVYGVERLRVLLDNEFSDLKNQYPQIFPPSFLRLPTDGIPTQRRHLMILYDKVDEPLALWLTRKLTILGYRIWCAGAPNLSEKTFPTDIDSAMQSEVSGVVALFSDASLQNPNFVRQHLLAGSMPSVDKPEFVIPLRVNDFDERLLDANTRNLMTIEFTTRWSEGLKHLVSRLENMNIPRDQGHGAADAIRSLLAERKLNATPETLYSNCYEVEQIPRNLLRIIFASDVTVSSSNALQHKWAHRRLTGRKFLSFVLPPGHLLANHNISGVELVDWKAKKAVDRVNTSHVVSELIRKSLAVKCGELGLHYCETYRLHYFPYEFFSGSNVLKYRSQSGRKTWLFTAGERKRKRSASDRHYRYHLAPDFYVRADLFSAFVVVLNVRIRFSLQNGKPLDPKTAFTYRKQLGKNWWNAQWFGRTSAIAEFMGNDGFITMGDRDGSEIRIRSNPYIAYSANGFSEA